MRDSGGSDAGCGIINHTVHDFSITVSVFGTLASAFMLPSVTTHPPFVSECVYIYWPCLCLRLSRQYDIFFWLNLVAHANYSHAFETKQNELCVCSVHLVLVLIYKTDGVYKIVKLYWCRMAFIPIAVRMCNEERYQAKIQFLEQWNVQMFRNATLYN